MKKMTDEEQNYVVDTSFSWADEISIHEFCILSKSKIDEYKKKLSTYDDNYVFEYGCGTNEIAYLTKSRLMDMLNLADPIPKEKIKVINEFVPYACRTSDLFEELLEVDDSEKIDSKDIFPVKMHRLLNAAFEESKNSNLVFK